MVTGGTTAGLIRQLGPSAHEGLPTTLPGGSARVAKRGEFYVKAAATSAIPGPAGCEHFQINPLTAHGGSGHRAPGT